MAKTLIFTDTAKNAKHSANWNTAKAAVQAVIDLYEDTSLPALVTGELSPLLNDTDNFLFNKMTGGQGATLTFGEDEEAVSLPIPTEQAKNIVGKPSGYNELMAGIEDLAKKSLAGWGIQGDGKASFSIAEIASCFIIDGAGLLQFSTSLTTLISNYGKYYIKTAIAKKLHAFAGDVVAAFFENDLHESISYLPGGDALDLRQIIDMTITSIKLSGETFVPNYEALTAKDNDLISLGFTES